MMNGTCEKMSDPLPGIEPITITIAGEDIKNVPPRPVGKYFTFLGRNENKN